jgi:hypothetical protein
LPEDWGGDLRNCRATSANEGVGTALRAFAHPTPDWVPFALQVIFVTG